MKRNIQHYEQLIGEKTEQTERMMKFVQSKKKFEREMREMKEAHEKAIKENKTLWAQQQTENREKWEKTKKQEIAESTLKGIEPEIQRIIGGSKQEIKKITEKYEILKEEFN